MSLPKHFDRMLGKLFRGDINEIPGCVQERHVEVIQSGIRNSNLVDISPAREIHDRMDIGDTYPMQNIAPPWTTFTLLYLNSANQASALHVASIQFSSSEQAQGYLRQFRASRDAAELCVGENCKWVLICNRITELNKDAGVMVWPLMFFTTINNDGSCFKSIYQWLGRRPHSALYEFFGAMPGDTPTKISKREVDEYFKETHYEFLSGIELINCRNVATVPETVKPHMPRGMRKNAPRLRYHTLAINGLSPQPRKSSSSSASDLMPLHVCRGSFARYGDDKKLFGKLTGTFWRPMHVKGKSKNGHVVKDYRLSDK